MGSENSVFDDLILAEVRRRNRVMFKPLSVEECMESAEVDILADHYEKSKKDLLRERIALDEMIDRLQIKQKIDENEIKQLKRQLSEINSENSRNIAELARVQQENRANIAESQLLRMNVRDKERERIESEQMYNRLRSEYDTMSMDYANLRSNANLHEKHGFEQHNFLVSSSVIGGLAVILSICIILLIKRCVHRKKKQGNNSQMNRKKNFPNMMTLGNFKSKQMNEVIMDIDVSRYTVGQHKKENYKNENSIASAINDDDTQISDDLFGVFIEGQETGKS